MSNPVSARINSAVNQSLMRALGQRIESYGPKFVENIVQAISRDILCYAMRTLRNYRICGHVHDELVIECPEDTNVAEICEMMGRTPPWTEGLPLRADGYECNFYKKD